MLKNTQEFKEKLENDISQITINKKFPLILKGSFKIKPFGSYLTDIDYTAIVKYNDSLVKRLVQIIQNVSRDNKFIFIRLKCGVYQDLGIPWEIDKFGGCDFDLLKTINWFKNIKNKIDKETSVKISEILNKDKLLIEDLIEIEFLLKNDLEIIWTKEDIERGYIIKDGITYNLVDQMKNSPLCVAKFLYRYPYQGNNYYVSIDVGLIDKEFPNQFKMKLYPFYTDDWYKIFKTYKFLLKPEYSEQYLSDLKEIEKLTAINSYIRMILKILKYRLTDKKDFIFLSRKLKEKLEEEKFTLYPDLKLIEKDIQKRLNDEVYKYIDFYKTKLTDKYLKEYGLFFDRTDYAKIPISRENLIERRNQGIKCPFYEIDISEFNILYTLADKLLLNYKDLIACVIKLSKENNFQIKDFIDRYLTDKNYKINKTENEVILFQDENMIKILPISDLKILQKIALFEK